MLAIQWKVLQVPGILFLDRQFPVIIKYCGYRIYICFDYDASIKIKFLSRRYTLLREAEEIIPYSFMSCKQGADKNISQLYFQCIDENICTILFTTSIYDLIAPNFVFPFLPLFKRIPHILCLNSNTHLFKHGCSPQSVSVHQPHKRTEIRALRGKAEQAQKASPTSSQQTRTTIIGSKLIIRC